LTATTRKERAMHHTSVIRDTKFLHAADYSGNVEIVNNTGRIDVPFEDLLDFVAHYVLGKKMEVLENMSTNQILGL
jgi:hypothetical protein